MMASLARVPGGAYDHLIVGLHSAPERGVDALVRLVYRALDAEQIDSMDADDLHQAARSRLDAFAARRRIREHQHPLAIMPARPRDDRRRFRDKRRTWGASGALPHQFRCMFTQGENAVAGVIRAEVRRHGCCTLSYADIARRAGLLSTTVVKRFVREARKAKLIEVQVRPVPGGRNNTNIITIVHPEWVKWNALAEASGGTGVPTYKNQRENYLSLTANRATKGLVKPQQVAWEDRRAAARAARTG